MLILLSPSKAQNFDKQTQTDQFSEPRFLSYSKDLLQELKKYKPDDISSLMSLSEKLAELNYNRFKKFEFPFSPENAKQAVFAFTGDVYTGLDLNSYTKEDLDFAQKHLRIISGLYGALKPLDLIQAYRLEMKTKLENKKGKNLYEFWKGILTNSIKEDMCDNNDKVIINLASNEYSKAINLKSINGKVITPVFKEKKGTDYKIIAIFAKKARGMMTNYIIKSKIEDLDSIKDFHQDNYLYNDSLSSDNEYVFTRG